MNLSKIITLGCQQLLIIMANIDIALIIVLFGTTISTGTKLKFTKSYELLNNRGLYDDWWQNAVFYQIYPRSFKDSNNDGSGDLQGIIQKLDHFKDIDIDAIWLSPIYKSPQIDNGYDISDYRDVDELYGTLQDLRQLVDEAHKRGLKVILDYVPNHTSDQHKWFQASLKGDPKYDDYYIWKNATYVNGERKPPNNWLSSFKGSAWEWIEDRQQYYFHQFAAAQPDLNYRNPEVVDEMKDVLRYWLNFGIDGFRMDAVYTMFEDIQLRDEPKSGTTDDPNDYNYLSHIYTSNQNETYDMIYQFRAVLDEFNEQNNTYNRVMMTEVYADVEDTMPYYVNGDYTKYGAHFTFNFLTFVLLTQKGFSASDLVENIGVWLQNLPNGCTSNWVLGNHDQRRVSSRLGVENIDAFNILAAFLSGVQITYQGEEIGQENGEVTCEQGYDPQAIKNCSTFDEVSRDFERTPFQWSNLTNAGFNDGNTTWLPVSKKYHETNLARQNKSESKTHYSIYKNVVQIKKNFRTTKTDAITLGYYANNIFYAERVTDNAHFVVVFNVADSEQVILDSFIENGILEVAVSSLNSDYVIGEAFNVSRPLKPRESVLLDVKRLS